MNSLNIEKALGGTARIKSDSTQLLKPKLNETQQNYRNAMSNLAAAVNIITTNGAAGKAGFTASAVCSVTDTPPTLLVCLNKNASVYQTFKNNKVLCVNTLALEHRELSNLFGGKTPMPERFAQGNWTTLTTGSPVLEDAILSFDCEVKAINTVGTHDIFICEVVDIRHKPESQSLVYFNRDYHQLSKVNH